MPTTATTSITLPRISAGAAGQTALDVLNAPVIAAEAALNELSGRLDDLNTKSAVIRHGVPISTDVTAGMLVYYNVEESVFSPAIAKLEATPGANGASIEAPESRVEGLILRTDSDKNVATMLCGGYYEDETVAQACLAGATAAGTYYLSPTVAGTATAYTYGHLRQAVLSYYGKGKLNLNLFYMAHDNHFHGSAVLGSAWVADGNDTMRYNTAADPQFESMGELSKQTTAIFYNGILQSTDADLYIEDGAIRYRGSVMPASGSVTVFNHYPFAYNSAVIRSITTQNDSALTVKNVNGNVTLIPGDFVDGNTESAPAAVSGISGNQINYTPVVTGVSAAGGIKINKTAAGEVILSSAELMDTLLDAYSVNHNGTMLTSDNIFTYFTFPAGRTSELVMTLPVRSIAEGTKLNATAWVCMYGEGAATFNTRTRFIADPSVSGRAVIPREGSEYTSEINATGSAEYVTFAEMRDPVEVTGNGLLSTVITISSAPTTEIRLIRIGFKLTVAQTTDLV